MFRLPEHDDIVEILLSHFPARNRSPTVGMGRGFRIDEQVMPTRGEPLDQAGSICATSGLFGLETIPTAFFEADLAIAKEKLYKVGAGRVSQPPNRALRGLAPIATD
jgi:hypothetical protein